MSVQPESSDLVEDASDDGQLTIRIPNPKVYMARQSQWVGRRGKPRCDHCRSGNLKCDRVLPMCNHCSWANQTECTYTPMPTPAHRGIPRCDRCRASNMKCDRNLPVCNNCERDAGGAACNYTPKKRHKQRSTEEDPAKASMKIGQSILSQKSEKPLPKNEETDATGSHTFYGHNVALPGGITISPTLSEADSQSDVETGQTGRFTADFAKGTHSFPVYPSGGVQTHTISAPMEFIPHAFPSPQEHKLGINNAHIEPWIHQSFVSLPNFVCKRLRQLYIVEFPNRRDFDTSLLDFQNGMMDELRETTCLPADAYTKVARCLASGNLSPLSDRVQSWASIHRLCSGSPKYNLILVPRDDSLFSEDSAKVENQKRHFLADLLSAKSDVESLQAHKFDRLPVRQQIYDILTYAHRAHRPATEMLSEVAHLRFAFISWPMAEMYVKMCPTCNMHNEEDYYSSSPSP